MSMLNSISDFSSTPIAIRRSIRSFARKIFRLANNAIAAFIAQREHQADQTILRSMTDRELRDIGIERSQVGAGLAQAAGERARAQRLLARMSESDRKVRAQRHRQGSAGQALKFMKRLLSSEITGPKFPNLVQMGISVRECGESRRHAPQSSIREDGQ
jgi:uncharacterized protein YjiS (DUF1127 family)